MQKRMIGVICGAAVVVLLAGSVVLLTRPSGKEDSSSDATAATTQSAEDLAALTLSDESADNVKQISVTNATGSYEVDRANTAKTTTATDATDATDSTAATTGTESADFRISGWEDIPTNESLLGTLANNTASLQADQCVEEHATDLDKFGLGKDATQVSMQFDDGTTFAFRIGGSDGAIDHDKGTIRVSTDQDDLTALTPTVVTTKGAVVDTGAPLVVLA